MNHGYSVLRFIVIVILYVSIGLMAAAGAIFMARKILPPKAEQIFYAMFLIMIALFYLYSAAITLFNDFMMRFGKPRSFENGSAQ
jgi:hypothetical protein